MNAPHDPRDPALEERLRAHFADRAANEPLPGEPGEPPALRPSRGWWSRPGWLVSAAAVLVVAGVAAGLALAGDGDPEDVDVVGPSTTTSAPLTSTTVAVTPPTVEATGSTTTTGPPPPPNDVRSVIVSVDGILGWWDGTRYVRASEGLPVPVVGGERYTIVGLDRAPTTAIGSAPEEGCEFPAQQMTVDVGLGQRRGDFDTGPIAVTGVEDPAPRAVQVLAVQPLYVEAAAQAVAGLGVDDPSPEVVQVVRVDLEGDGVDEVLLVAERLSGNHGLIAAPGEYSVVLLRQVIDEEVVTSVVYSSVAEEDPEFTPYVGFARVAAVADLDGDGTMEVVFAAFGYEGTQLLASRVLPTGGTEQVLDNYCGV